MNNYPPLPTARLENLYSFYDYSISPRERAHASLCGGAWGSGSGSSRSGSVCTRSASAPYPGSRNPNLPTLSNPTPSHATPTSHRGLFPIKSLQTLAPRRLAVKRATDRVVRRALAGKRTAGAALAHDAQDLSDDEDALEKDKATVNAFGYRFLMPFGRMMTQMQMESAVSPTPSDADHQQEDRNNHEHAATPLATPEGDADEVDLDASVEDMDRADDRSTEYDSDDLRLMRDMDRSVGSRTPMSDEEDMDEE